MWARRVTAAKSRMPSERHGEGQLCGHSIRQSRKKNHPSALTRAMVVMLSGFVSVPGAQIYYETYTPEHTQQKQPDVQTLMCTPVGRTHSLSHSAGLTVGWHCPDHRLLLLLQTTTG